MLLQKRRACFAPSVHFVRPEIPIGIISRLFHQPTSGNDMEHPLI